MLIEKINKLIIVNSSNKNLMKAILKYLIKNNIKYFIKPDGVYFQLDNLTFDQLHDIENIIDEYSISFVIDLNLF